MVDKKDGFFVQNLLLSMTSLTNLRKEQRIASFDELPASFDELSASLTCYQFSNNYQQIIIS